MGDGSFQESMVSIIVRRDLNKSDIYGDFLPRLNSGEVDLLDNPRLVSQFARPWNGRHRAADAIQSTTRRAVMTIWRIAWLVRSL